MTLKEAKQVVRELGGSLSFSRDYGEYTVRFGKASYFTDDREDALGTAKFMSEEVKRLARKEEVCTTDPILQSC